MTTVTAMNEYEYLSKTRSLLYATTCCRPDIQHGVSTEAQASKHRHQMHCFKLERTLKYLFQTKDTHLFSGSKGNDLVLRAYFDASFGSTLKTDTNLRSCYGWVFTYGGCPISWCVKRFDSTSLAARDSLLSENFSKRLKHVTIPRQ